LEQSIREKNVGTQFTCTSFGVALSECLKKKKIKKEMVEEMAD
jgi:hypothetical protein